MFAQIANDERKAGCGAYPLFFPQTNSNGLVCMHTAERVASVPFKS